MLIYLAYSSIQLEVLSYRILYSSIYYTLLIILYTILQLNTILNCSLIINPYYLTLKCTHYLQMWIDRILISSVVFSLILEYIATLLLDYYKQKCWQDSGDLTSTKQLLCGSLLMLLSDSLRWYDSSKTTPIQTAYIQALGHVIQRGHVTQW